MSAASYPSVARAAIPRPAFFDQDDQVWLSYLELNPTVDLEHTRFLSAIVDAKVERNVPIDMNPEDGSGDWNCLKAIVEAPSTAIRIVKINFPRHHEAMADGMSIAVLPLDLPMPMGMSRNVMFVRNEDIGLIKAWNSKDKQHILVILGNPGVSKSWHLWKYLVMAANTDVWDACNGSSPFPKKPEVIVYATPTARFLYFLEEKIVHRIRQPQHFHVLQMLNYYAKHHSIRMLYEPVASMDPIPYDLSTDHYTPCTAALSPAPIRYKKMLKQDQAIPHIMPCPTKPELVAMFMCIGYFQLLNQEGLAAKINKLDERLKKVGPFIRLLLLDDDAFQQECASTASYIQSMSAHELANASRDIDAEYPSSRAVNTYRYARYVTPRAIEGNFTTSDLVPSTDGIVLHLKTEALSRGEGTLRNDLNDFDQYRSPKLFNPKSFESLMQLYITGISGLQWKYAQCQISSHGSHHTGTSELALTMNCNKQNVSYYSPTVSMMLTDTLYAPQLSNYPFVDLLWVDEEGNFDTKTVFAIQCTVSASHVTGISVCHTLRNKLGMTDGQKLVVYIATIRRFTDKYRTGAFSTFFPGSRSGAKIPTNLEFRVLLPGRDMCNTTRG